MQLSSRRAAPPIVTVVAALMAVGVHCGPGSTGATGAAAVVNVTPVGPGSQCPAGGYEIQWGVAPGDSGLDAGEAQTTKYVCNGVSAGDGGGSSLVSVSPAGPGSQCPAGGYEIQEGADTNGDGRLETGEVQTTSYVCNGASPTLDAGGPQAVAVTAGAAHTCALLLDGSVWCWGDDSAHELGPAGGQALYFTSISLTPVAVPLPKPATAIAAGESYSTCALLVDGTVWCWGDDTHDELATTTVPIGSPPSSATPVQVDLPTPSKATAITLGDDQACALLTDASVWCWGGNGSGQLVSATGTTSSVPVKLTGNAFAVAAGNQFECALSATLVGGNFLCWGIAGKASAEAFGFLGGNYTSIAVGNEHVCGIQAAPTSSDFSAGVIGNVGGTVVCLGDNSEGALGIASTTAETGNNLGSPVATLANATLLAAGAETSCAVVAPDGALACWGENDHGELGNGTTTSSAVPVWVYGLSQVTSVAAGGYASSEEGQTFGHTCAVSHGEVWCWGNNQFGQLGNGTTIEALAPVPVAWGAAIGGADASADATVAEGGASDAAAGSAADASSAGDANTAGAESGSASRATAIAGGLFHTCAVLSGGTVACWGDNAYGELGNGSTTSSSTPVPVSGLSGVTALAAGEYFTCALLQGGTVDCWGYDNVGVLGDSTANSLTPVAVTGLSGVIAIAAGVHHTCALLSGGSVACWGDNSYDQLGNGTPTRSSTPLLVSGLSGVTAIAAGGNQGCALLSGGTVDCWGESENGGLGNGTPQAPYVSATPVAVVGASGVSAIGEGLNQGCALLSSGTVDCWGVDQGGENDAGTVTDSLTAVAVPGLSGATAIAVGGNQECALLQGGTIRCWGDDRYGELGNGTTLTNMVPIVVTPVAVAGLGGVTAIAGGGYHMCALLPSGTVDCWGNNADGQLGNGTTTDSSTPVRVTGL